MIGTEMVGQSSADAAGLRGLVDTVNGLNPDGSDSSLIDQIAALEQLKSACAAAQARLTHSFAVAQTADGTARKQSVDNTRRSIAAQIALARRDSRHRGQQHVGVAHALVSEMPALQSALREGTVSEYRARVVIEQFACLTPADRNRADGIIAPELPGLGDRTAQTRAAAIAYRLDPEAVMAKVRGAATDRHVSVRPAPDTMSRLSALLPVAQGVAIYAALAKAAIATLAVSNDRTRGQVMADELVSRVTGQVVTGCDSYGAPTYGDDVSPDSTGAGEDAVDRAVADRDVANRDFADDDVADAGQGIADQEVADQDVANFQGGASDCAGHDCVECETDRCDPDLDGAERHRTIRPGGALPGPDRNTAADHQPPDGLKLNLIMTDRTLFGCDDEPAHLTGYGPIPAALARSLVIGNADSATKTWVRRLYTDPTGTQLVAMDSRQRLFPATAQKFLIARDQTCRTPWCDAPIRHIDHIVPHARGGPTHIDNGQGLCEACNLSKQASGWRSRVTGDGSIATTTPTGHTYRSKAPSLPTSSSWPVISMIEERLARQLLAVA